MVQIWDDAAVAALEAAFKAEKDWGLRASVDLYKCSHELICDPEAIKAYVVEVIDRVEMRRYGPCHVKRFGEKELEGWSFFQFIMESNADGHFDEVANNAHLRLFSCRWFDPRIMEDFSAEYFQAEYSTMEVSRVRSVPGPDARHYPNRVSLRRS